jgi:hypothetical protein
MNAEDYGTEQFEYDMEDTGEAGDTEAGDESYEASDEAGDESYEASDEAGDEGFEASDEADEGSDEADEATITLGEAMEADEGDTEADESFGEAVQMSASAQLRADRDRNRRRAWSRRLAADQRLEAQRAAALQRSITSRIRAIPVKATTGVTSVGTLQGAGVVTAILPNGRRTRMRIVPTVAPIREVNRLRSVVLANERRQAAAIRTNTKALTALAATQTTAVKKLTEAQVKSDKDLSRRIVEGDNRLDQRITKELTGGTGILDRHNKKLIRVLKRERRRAMMNNVLLATSIPFFVAYGEKEDLLKSTDNWVLVGSTLFWLLGDDVLSSFVKEKGAMQNVASIWSYAGFAANAGTLYWWFRNTDNRRFLAGVSTIKFGDNKINIADELKKDSRSDFKDGSHIAVATFIEKPHVLDTATTAKMAPPILRTSVDDGILTLSWDSANGPVPADKTVKVAWLVDTKPSIRVEPLKNP